MQQPRKRRPEPYLVSHVTDSMMMTLLTITLTLRGCAALFRIVQRLQWLLFDFRPLGQMWEAVFMAVTQGVIFAGNLITLLMAVAALRLRLAHGHRRGRMMYHMAKLMKVLYTIALLLSLALTGGLVYAAVHYRLPVMWIGGVSVVGAVLVIMSWIGRMFHKNVSRVMVDVNHSMPRGRFERGGGVSCHLQTQGWLLAVFNLVPMAIVVLWGVISVWLIQSLRQLFGSVLVDQLMAQFAGSLTSPVSMYGMELMEMALTVCCYALTALLYARYMHAHDERVPAHWHTREAA